MSRNQIRFLILVLIVGAGIGVNKLAHSLFAQELHVNVSETSILTIDQNDYKLLALPSLGYENLQVFAIIGEALIDKKYVTLEEAMRNNMVRLNETGDVNQLSIDNLSESYVFIQAGDIVKGGKQDRTLQKDLILAPNETKVALNSFCVESGRWEMRSGESAGFFSISENALSSRKLKLAAKKDANQGKVWEEVSEQQEKFNHNVRKQYNMASYDVADNISASSYQLTLEDEKLKEFKDDYKKNLISVLETKNIIGLAYAVNGELYGADIFNNEQLFKDLSQKLLAAFILEAISNRTDPLNLKKTTEKEVNKVLTVHLDAKPETSMSEKLNATTYYEFQEFGLINRFITTDSNVDQWLHMNYIIDFKDLHPKTDNNQNIEYNPRR